MSWKLLFEKCRYMGWLPIQRDFTGTRITVELAVVHVGSPRVLCNSPGRPTQFTVCAQRNTKREQTTMANVIGSPKYHSPPIYRLPESICFMSHLANPKLVAPGYRFRCWPRTYYVNLIKQPRPRQFAGWLDDFSQCPLGVRCDPTASTDNLRVMLHEDSMSPTRRNREKGYVPWLT